MQNATIEIGTVSDEVSRDLSDAFETAMSWGIWHFELREGSKARFPNFLREEWNAVDAAVQAGAKITAVSPGIFKGNAAESRRIADEIERTLKPSIEVAHRLNCSKIIVFGFEKSVDEPVSNRAEALRAFEQAGNLAHEAGIRIVIENEPNFWIDMPETSAEMMRELDHAAIALNWDPGNMSWGGVKNINKAHFDAVNPFMQNLHIKDFYPQDAQFPWRPVGMGVTNWENILQWVKAESTLENITLEVHTNPLKESTKASLETVRSLMDN